MRRMSGRRGEPTALSALDGIREARAYLGFVGDRHPPSGAEGVALRVLKVIIRLQGHNTGVSFARPKITRRTVCVREEGENQTRFQ